MGELRIGYEFSAWTASGTEVSVVLGARFDPLSVVGHYGQRIERSKVVSTIRAAVRESPDGKTSEETVLEVFRVVSALDLPLTCVEVSTQALGVRIYVRGAP